MVILGPDGEPFQHAQEVYHDRRLARAERTRRIQAEHRAEWLAARSWGWGEDVD